MEPRQAPQTKRHPLAILETSKGTIKFILYPEVTPRTVANFIKLARKNFYSGLKFHRVEPGFVIQGGDPQGDGTGGPGWAIPNEKNGPLRHNRGAVAMANAGRDTAGSQFYIVVSKPARNLDERDPDGVNKYTIFGQVVAGQEIAEKMQVGDKILTVKIVE
jgi:peptidyl-prolyl cis-trans isomerase B (cyclophilin B)